MDFLEGLTKFYPETQECMPWVPEARIVPRGPDLSKWDPERRVGELEFEMTCSKQPDAISIDSWVQVKGKSEPRAAHFEDPRASQASSSPTATAASDDDEWWTIADSKRKDAIGKHQIPNKPYAPFKGGLKPRYGECSRFTTGKRKWRILADITVYRNGKRPFKRRFVSVSRSLTCPDVETLTLFEADAFKLLSRYHPDTGKPGRARSHLRDVLGDEPWKPAYVKGYAWAAHHIIPVADPPARNARALMFRCHVHPNEHRNGIYLRGYTLRQGTQAYEDLLHFSPALARRMFHDDTQREREDFDYFDYLNKELGGFYRASDGCRIDGQPQYRQVKQALDYRIEPDVRTSNTGAERGN